MSAGLRGEVRAFLADARARGAYRPHCDSWMSEFDAAFSAELGDRGWIGMTWPVRYGGHGRSERERLVVVEELLAAGAPVAAHWFADRQIGPGLLAHGTEAQRQRYLPEMAAGCCVVAIGMSEPDSGSDLASIRTSARRGPGGWLVSGTKVWTSHAHEARYLLALVRTSPADPQRRHEGLSQFLIDLRLPGVEVRPIVTLDGRHHFNEVVLTDVPVADDALLGTEGRGWQQVVAELAYERSGPERYLSNLRLLAALSARADVPDAEVGELVAQLQTLRALSAGVADAIADGRAPAVEAALVKDLGTRYERTVVDAARRLAPVPLDADSPDDYTRLLTEAVLHGPDGTLRGGANEILRGIVGRELTATGAGRTPRGEIRAAVQEALGKHVLRGPDGAADAEAMAACTAELVAAGWGGVGLPEELGGEGGTLADAAEVVAAVTYAGLAGPLADRLLVGNPLARRGGRDAELFGALARSVQIAAALERALDLTLTYTAQRRQFGKALAEQPVVRHELAGLAGEAAAARAAAAAAVRAMEADPDAEPGREVVRAVAVAKIRTGLAATHGLRLAHQLHGAMGITREYELHLHTRAAWAWRDEHGSERAWASRLGRDLRADGADLWAALVAVPTPERDHAC